MKISKKCKSLLLLCLFAYSFNAAANERISFTGQDIKSISCGISATYGKEFTIDWGDGSDIETKTGTGNQSISHTYANYGDYTVDITGVTADCFFTALNCSGKQLTILDLSANTALKWLDCSKNQLSTLDLSTNTALGWLDCSENQLDILDLSVHTELTVVLCYNNRLTTLKLSTGLYFLQCYNNQLTALDLSTSTKLEMLHSSNNQLTVLDLSAHTHLWDMQCAHNQLTDLYVAASGMLGILDCDDNQLTALDVSVYPNLYILSCGNNQLTELDISANKELFYFYCNNNQLTSLDLSANTALDYMECYNNHLPLSDLYHASEIVSSKRLGRQRLASQAIEEGGSVDFSAQKEFGGVVTVFVVEKNGSPAPQGDYAIADGIITFNNTGNYTITMTNSAIVSEPDYPAEVIVEVKVGNEGITEATQEQIKIYPNPTDGKLQVTSYELPIGEIVIWDIMGRKVLSQKAESGKQNELDISYLPAGMYFVRVQTDKGVVTRKVVKR